MFHNSTRIIFSLFFLFLTSSTLQSQKNKKNKKDYKTNTEEKSLIKKYSELISKKTLSDEGLFKVHQNDEKFYFEIPFDVLDQDMLLVSRISKIPSNLGGGYVNAGSKTNEQLVKWTRIRNNIHLKSISYSSVANDSLPIHLSVRDNNYHPVIYSFKIAAFSPDSTAALIEVNDLFLTDVTAISGLSQAMRKKYKVKKMDSKRSFIHSISSFPKNVEVKHDLTFVASAPPSNTRSGTISLEMRQSLYLLPEEPMQSRLYDKRVGWFTIDQVDYGSEKLKADRKSYIRRWKLIPKDKKAYAEGKLVAPEKPIVYYLDPATPKKWIPYFKQGIEDWQAAFETAGFKNAIIAKEAPTSDENPDWSPEDARYSTVRYVASTTRNAIGPSVTDPRSGEIIESDIIWYHNHLRSYRNRYLLETGAANPSARTLRTPEKEIGEMMRRVISHEVGHALGLPHNMKASAAYPTDSLRSASFTQKWGLASSIMDYTRYNYVAQPSDKGVRWVRMLGPYDNYAISWGYRYIPEARSAEDERSTLNKWIVNKKGNPVYLFGGYNPYDPSSQTENVGDDVIKASTYGLSNLKIVVSNLKEWTTTEGEGYEDLKELYGELIGVWSRYSGHVLKNIGGIYEEFKTTDQSGEVYKHIDKNKQSRSLNFLIENSFTTPYWLLQDDIINNIDPSGIVERIQALQYQQLNNLLREDRLMRMINNKALNGEKAYAITTLLKEVREGIWAELTQGKSIDVFRRNIQRSHVEILIKLLHNTHKKPSSDIQAVARAELKSIQSLVKKSLASFNDGIVKYHLKDIHELIKNNLEVKRKETKAK
ncbi:zinc-dependent metalloprotease [Aquimarina sp. M1]